MKEFDRFSFPRNYSGKVPLFFRKFPEKFRRKFPNSQPYSHMMLVFESDNISTIKVKKKTSH